MKPDLGGLRGTRGFTLLEIVIVIGIIALLATFLLSRGGHPRDSRRRVTQSMMHSIEAGLESYRAQFGEYPESANLNETAEVRPGKTYRIGAAKCLYQSLSGDGADAIKGAATNAKPCPAADGKIDTEETENVIIRDIPGAFLHRVGGHYLLVDAFGNPFQYAKANSDNSSTIRPSYDLWSYGEDHKNILSTSKDAESDPKRATKWIKNW